ncbi:MAG: EAL domain-containing protein [Clostridiaceae bacterium]|nr:EAL domain-containing protein [Eubacteriales bacterium]
MNRLDVFSALYLIVASLSPVMGMYALRLNRKGAVNKVFFLISICLTLWAFGFSVVVAAPSEKAAAVWMRVSAIGIEILYSAMAHFSLLLTGHTKLMRKWWIYPLLYLPAAVCLYAFAISPQLTGQILRFSYTDSGWVRNTPSTVFDSIFQVYYACAVALSIGLLFFWKRGNAKPEIKKQANLLILSFVVAIVLGTFTDIINNNFIHLPLPQMAPVFFLLPLSAIFYCIVKYHMMAGAHTADTGLILSDERRIMVFRVASLGLIIGGVVLFLLEHFWWNAGNPVLTVFASLFLVALGIILAYTQRTRRGFMFLEVLLVLTTLVVTPILTTNMSPFGGTAMWVFPLIMVVSSLVFSTRYMLIAASLTIQFSQIYLWAIVPEVNIVINYRTYLSRIAILNCIMVIAYFVHKIYTDRIRENAAQTRTQSLVSGIASRFFLTAEEDAPEHMTALLKELAEFFEADTALICAVESEFRDLIGVHRYTAEGVELTPEHEMLCMERWNAFWPEYDGQQPGDAEREPAAERVKRLQSIPWLFVPIYNDARPVAFIYLETSRASEAWTKEQIAALPVVSRIVSDALEKLSTELRIKYMAYYDGLTRLPNRQLFHDRAEQAIHLARRSGHPLGFMFLDLDFFKSVNDTIGHEGGDALLQILGQRLVESLRKTDTVARFGGDEFLILLNAIADVDDISQVADKLMTVFRTPIDLNGQEVFITASAGISVFPVDGEDAQTLIKHADIAMYTAKEKGKNRYAFCSSNMKERVQYRACLTGNLHRALDRGELEVHYQPQVDLSDEKIVGLEALLRWRHPEYGMLPPNEFIPLAEQTGLINPIGAWVLMTACAQAAAWEKRGYGKLRVAVNISVVQLRSPAFAGVVAHALQKTGIDPAQLELEIAESTMTREPDYIVNVLSDLKALGVSISIDDFGIEYSSLNRLKLLPVDRLKMDMRFVRGIEGGERDKAVTMVIMNLAKNMDLKLVAEGVENSSQLDFLKDRMCDEAQGYFYFKPMPAADIEKILEK